MTADNFPRPLLVTKHHRIEANSVPYLIAEVGLNHNGDESLAIAMMEGAARAGAHCVKFQMFNTEGFIERKASFPEGPEGSLFDFFRRFELPRDSWRRLAQAADRLGVDFLCSVFDADSLGFYRELNPAYVKIASTDLTNRMLLEDAKAMGFELLLSTGASNEAEIERTISWVGRPALLFQCVSSYPARPDEYNLRLLPLWKEKFGCAVGLSDHCDDTVVSLASYVLGGAAIERHFTIDRRLPGPDQALSSTPEQFKKLRDDLETLSSALGTGVKDCAGSEVAVRTFGRRSLYFARQMAGGETVTRDDVIALRPGGGMGPELYDRYLGRILRAPVNRGQRLQPGDFT